MKHTTNTGTLLPSAAARGHSPAPAGLHRGFSALLLGGLLCLGLLAGSANAAPLSGTKTVGPTGDYASLTAAIVDIQAKSLGGAQVLQLQATYLGSVETFPLTIPALHGASALNTVTAPKPMTTWAVPRGLRRAMGTTR